MNPIVLKAEEVGKLFRVSRTKVHQLRQRAKDPLPAMVDNCTVRFDREAVLAWWERNAK